MGSLQPSEVECVDGDQEAARRECKEEAHPIRATRPATAVEK